MITKKRGRPRKQIETTEQPVVVKTAKRGRPRKQVEIIEQPVVTKTKKTLKRNKNHTQDSEIVEIGTGEFETYVDKNKINLCYNDTYTRWKLFINGKLQGSKFKAMNQAITQAKQIIQNDT